MLSPLVQLEVIRAKRLAEKDKEERRRIKAAKQEERRIQAAKQKQKEQALLRALAAQLLRQEQERRYAESQLSLCRCWIQSTWCSRHAVRRRKAAHTSQL